MSFSAVNAANVQDNSSNDLFSHDVFQSAELPVSDNQLASDNENDLLTVSADDDILSVSADDDFSAVSDGDDSLAVSEDNLLTVSADDEKLGEDETGSFNELQSIIDSNYGSTIVLDKSYAYSANDKTIEIKDSIIIDGNGFTIDGKNAVQIMNVTSNDVTIRNLTFVNGLLRRYYPGTAPDTSWTGYFGADISWIGDNGRIENCIFENSTLNPPLPTTMVTAGFYQYGGALYLQNFTNGVVNNCTFRNLRALAGGGIYIWSTEEDSNITISNSSFVNCTAYEWRAGGGAILVGAKKVNITQCNFTDNSAVQGGAVLIMHGSRYDTTVPNSTYPRRGISYMPGDGTVIEDCKFTNNTGGVIEGESGGYGGSAVYIGAPDCIIRDSTFDNNTNGMNGGGYGGAIMILINNPSASDAPKGVNATIFNCNFTGNNASSSGGSAYYGGAICQLSSYTGSFNTNISQCIFKENYAGYGGALYLLGSNTVDNCTFINNTANRYGGALYLTSSDNNVAGCVFEENKAENAQSTISNYGGAVYIGGSSYSTGSAHDNLIDNCSFEKNTADYGGAVYVANTGENTTIKDSNFTENSAQLQGGAVAVYAPTEIISSRFDSNTAENGGAVLLSCNSTNITKSNFTENSADEGGAVYCIGSYNLIGDSNFTKNHASDNGGAVAMLPYIVPRDNTVYTSTGYEYYYNIPYKTGNNRITGSTFDENYLSSEDGQGGAIYICGCENETIKECNFTNNTAYKGGAVSVVQFVSQNATKDVYYRPTKTWTRNITLEYVFNSTGIVIDGDLFEGNIAENGGAMYWKDSDGEITDSNYTKNRAFSGSAIFLDSGYLNISDSSFFSNLANASALEMNGVDSSLPNKVVVDGDKVSFHANFTGHDNINNAIFNNQEDAGRIKFKNVDFHGYNGNTGSSLVDTVNGYQNSENGVLPYQDEHEGLIPINFEVEKIDGDSAVLVANLTNNTKIDGFAEIIDLVLAPGKYRVTAIHYLDDYYTEVRSEAQEFVIRGNSSAHADDVEVTYDSDVVVAVETEYATGLKDIVIMDEDGTTLAVDFELVKIDDNHYEVTIKGLDVGKYSINFTTQVGDDYISECTNSSKIRVNPAPSYVWGEDVDVIFGEPIVIPVESVNATGIAYQIIDGSDNVVAEGALEVGGSIKDLDLPAGEYTVILTSVTDENHDSVSNTSNLIVRHKITVVLDPVIGYTGEYKDFHAHVFDENGNPVDGGEAVMTIVYTNRLALAISMNFLLNAADETYSASVVNGEAVFPNIKLGEPGVYPSQVLYTNDYASVKNESTVTILKLNTTVKGDDVSGKPGDSKSISVDVLDQNGNPVENGTVTLTLNGKTYNATVKNGKAVFDVVLPDPGDYEAVVKYEGNDYYNPSGSTIKVHVDKINTSPSADDVTGKKNEKKDITVNIVDENGKPVKNGTATLKIGGKSYNAEVVNGVAVFKDVELPSDDAVAEVIYHGNEYYNSSSTTFSIKIEHEKGNNESEPSNGKVEKSAELPISSATGNPFALLLISLVVLVSNSIFIRRK